MDIQIEQSQKLDIKQTLSPLMLQSLNILPMTALELSEYIGTQIENNPALEIPDSVFDSSTIKSDYTNSHDYTYDNLDNDSDNYSDTYSEKLNNPDDFNQSLSDEKTDFIENLSNSKETLSEHLLSQLGTLKITKEEREIGETLIGNLDVNGFFISPINSIFNNNDSDNVYTEEEIEKVITIIQSLDPIGTCVSNYKESLIIQAKALNLNPEDFFLISNIINNHLDLIKNDKYNQLSKELGVDEEDIISYVKIIKSLNPFPGNAFNYGSNTYIEPDISIRYHISKNNEKIIEINVSKTNLPNIKISESFKELTEKNKKNKKLQDFARQSIVQAENLISMVNLRYKTLYKTAVSLAKFQKEFFINGKEYLKTLRLEDVAKDINVHETTLSRLSQNKYVDTEWGIFSLKYFFSQGVNDVSRNSIKDLIFNIITNNPELSDQKIADKLKDSGISCARRTVNKYRKELNLESSYYRH